MTQWMTVILFLTLLPIGALFLWTGRLSVADPDERGRHHGLRVTIYWLSMIVIVGMYIVTWVVRAHVGDDTRPSVITTATLTIVFTLLLFAGCIYLARRWKRGTTSPSES